MNNNKTVLRCQVRKTTKGYEGTVLVPGLKPTKLAKRDESTIYANASGVQAAAKSLADRLGFGIEVDAPKATTTTKKTKKVEATTE